MVWEKPLLILGENEKGCDWVQFATKGKGETDEPKAEGRELAGRGKGLSR